MDRGDAATAVDEPGDDFLAGPRLAVQAGRGFSGRDLTGQFQHRTPSWAAADRRDFRRRRMLLQHGPCSGAHHA
jgi:hypothetical protein